MCVACLTTATLSNTLTGQKHTSSTLEDVVDLSQQQGHVTELRLPGLAEHLQVLLGDLTGRVEGQRLSRRDDLCKRVKDCDSRGGSISRDGNIMQGKDSNTMWCNSCLQLRN